MNRAVSRLNVIVSVGQELRPPSDSYQGASNNYEERRAALRKGIDIFLQQYHHKSQKERRKYYASLSTKDSHLKGWSSATESY